MLDLSSDTAGDIDCSTSEGAATGTCFARLLFCFADYGGVLFEGDTGGAVAGSGLDDWRLAGGGKLGGDFLDQCHSHRWFRVRC